MVSQPEVSQKLACDVACELVQQATGRGVDLGGARLSYFQRGVVFRNPVFDFNVKLFCLDDDLFCFCVSRNVGESVVDSISLPSTRLKIVGVLVRGFTQHQFCASKDTRWCPTLLTMRYPA